MDPQPPAVIFVTPPPPPVPAKELLPLRSFHYNVGLLQMAAGCVMFVLETAALSSNVPLTLGTGIYCGLLVFVCGLLSVTGAKRNSHPLIVACMIVNVVAAVACVIGLGWASFEVAWIRNLFDSLGASSRYERYTYSRSVARFGYGKSIFMVICCLAEFIVTVIHASLSCRSVCACCKQQRVVSATAASGQQICFQSQGAVAYIPQGSLYIPQPPAFGYVGPQGQLQATAGPPSYSDVSPYRDQQIPS